MVLSARPNETSDYIVMVICGYDQVLAFWRPGEQTWKKIEAYNGVYHDVFYHNGRFYALNCHGFVWGFDVVGNDVKEGRMITCLIANRSELHMKPDMYKLDMYMYMYMDMDMDMVRNELVVNLTLYILNLFGSLALITRAASGFDDENDRITYNTSKIRVYEVDESMGTWKEIDDLGSMAIFIGHSATTAVDAARFPGIIKPNHIYFTDDGWESYYYDEEKGGGKDMGVYNLETQTIEAFYSGELLLSKISPSIWITPLF